ncbi:MAG: hypothetical protein LBC73_03255, partial [Oscillospiraceae bacterium]|nr:hypothetical protein [Oscillospiraceae bacterium]
MDTRYETTSDNKTDTRSINADVGTDVSEELTNDEGVDLNALNDESSNEEKTLGKAFFAEYAPPLPVNDAIYAEAPANVTNDASPFTEEGQSRMIDEGQG